MTTVEELVRERLGEHGEVVAGHEGLDNAVSWAVTARARTPALDPLKGAELVLLPPATLAHLGGDAALASLLAGFREGGAAGVVLWSAPQPTACREADARGLPLVVLRDAPPADVERALLEYIAGRLREGLAQQQDRQTRLLDTLAANRGVEAIVQVLADTLGRPAAYVSVSGQRVASVQGGAESGFELPDDFWAQVPPERAVAPLAVPGDGGRLWVSPVIRNGARQGALMVRSATAPTPSESLSLRQTAAAIAVAQGRADAASAAERRLRDELYRDLFEGRGGDTLHRRARALGVPLPERSLVAVVAPRNPGVPLPQAVKDRLHAVVVRPAAAPALDGGRELMLLLPPTVRGEHAARLLARALAPFDGQLAVGVSDGVEGLPRVPRAAEEARTALLVSRQVRDGAPTHFAETGAYGLLAAIRDTPFAHQAVSRHVGPLTEYDAQHASALTGTLETYLECNGNSSEAAKRLNLHRNSLAYRLRRIEELTGLDLASSECRLLLTLALRLRRLLGGGMMPP
jgi:purine catabolism regulator